MCTNTTSLVAFFAWRRWKNVNADVMRKLLSLFSGKHSSFMIQASIWFRAILLATFCVRFSVYIGLVWFVFFYAHFSDSCLRADLSVFSIALTIHDRWQFIIIKAIATCRYFSVECFRSLSFHNIIIVPILLFNYQLTENYLKMSHNIRVILFSLWFVIFSFHFIPLSFIHCMAFSLS